MLIDGWGISCEIALIWMSLDFTDDQSTLVQIMAWCHQATSHYLCQCWLRSLLPYGVTRPQWVKFICHDQIKILYHFYPSALRAGGVLSSRSGRPGGRAGGWAGGCQTCGTHISVTAWWIFSIRSSVELYRPVVVHRRGHLPICPKWACPWPKNLSNLVQIGSRLCGTHISETAGWIDPI